MSRQPQHKNYKNLVRVTLEERRIRTIRSVELRTAPPTLTELCLDNAMNTLHGRPIIEQFVAEGLLERYRDEKRVYRYKLKEPACSN